MYTVTTTKGETEHATLGEAIRACGSDPHNFAAFGPTITSADGSQIFSFEIIDDGENLRITVTDAQDLCSAFGGDLRESDNDGLHWPYAPTLDELADVIADFVPNQGEQDNRALRLFDDVLKELAK